MIKRYRTIYIDGSKGDWVRGTPGIMDYQNSPDVVGLDWEHAPPKCGATSRVEVDGEALKCENTLCSDGVHTVWYETHDSYGSVDYLEITWYDKEREA